MIGPCLVRSARRGGNPRAQSKFQCLACCVRSNLLRNPYPSACKQAPIPLKEMKSGSSPYKLAGETLKP